MKKPVVILLAVFVGFFSCKMMKKSSPKTAQTATVTKPIIMTTPSGLQYEITHKGTGKKPGAGDKVTVHYTGKFLNDSVFDSSVRRNEPFSFVLGKGQVIKGWDEGIALLQVGDKARFTIPSQLGYGDRAVGPIPPNSTLVFDVELLDVKESVKPVPYDITGKPVQKTASGLEYVIVEEGKVSGLGVKPVAGQTVTVNYTGYFKDGKIFDSSIESGQPISFQLGKGMVIKGWDEGIALLSVGSKARLIIPYNLAYGENGYPGAIPPKSDLIFDVQLLDVK